VSSSEKIPASAAPTTSPISDMQDSLLPWASSTEAALAGKLADVELFVELDIDGDELERTSRFFGTFIARQVAAGSTEEALLQACPALTIATLLSRAARFHEVSELPAEYWYGLGLEPTPTRTQLIEGRFGELLSAAGLDPMDAVSGGPDGELGRLFAHVGIASDWVPELIELVDNRRADSEASEDSGEGADAADIARAVVAELADEPRQVGPLCATLPEAAVKLIAPIVEIVSHAAAHPDSWEYTLPAVELPALILEDVIEELRERPVGTQDRRHSVGVAHREDQPRLQLDTLRQRVVLRLPSQPLESEGKVHTEVRWRVDFDGEPAAFRTMHADNAGRAVTEILDIPVRQPLRKVSVRNANDGQHWQLPLVDTEDPVLVFTIRGTDLTDRVSLHHEQVYVVVPSETAAVDPVTGADIPVLEEQPMKSWNGWVIRLLDLSECLSLHIAKPGERSPSMAGVRAVDPRQRAQFVEPDDVVGGVETTSGKVIHSQSLQVEFPPTISGADEIWYLSVSAYAGPGKTGEAVSDEEPLEVPAEGGVFDVFDPEAWDSPWVGEYLVRLRGPRNESFRHEYALVEGLSLEMEFGGPSNQTRLPMAGGLSPVTVRLLPGEKPFEKIPPQKLGPTDRFSTTVVQTDAGDALPVIVKPSRLRYQLTMQGEDPMWRTDPIEVSARSIDTQTRFRVRPGFRPGMGSKAENLALMDDARVVIRNHHGSPVRTLKLETIDEVTWFVDLASAAGSLATLTSGAIELEFVEDRRVSVRLARIGPGFDYTASVDGDALFIHGGDESEETPVQFGAPGAGAWVWPITAPWQPAYFVELQATPSAAGTLEKSALAQGTLPAELVGAGPLSVQLFGRDRFNYLRAPVAAGQHAAVAQAEGYFGANKEDADTDPWVQLAAFLAGESEELPSDTATLSTLWDVQAGWLRGRFDVLDNLRTALTNNPRESVHAMSQSLVPAADRPAQFILSGLVHSTLVGAEAERSNPPWIAALEILGDMSLVDPEGASEEKEQDKRLRQELKKVAGQPAVQTVDTGRDVSLDTACIDSTTVQIAHMDPAQQKAVLDMFFGKAGVVPGALSEENSRLIAVFETFNKRAELSELLGDPELMKTAVTLLRKVKAANRQLYLSARVRFDRLEGVDTDTPENRWALTPVISMVFALATRMYAHKKMSSLGKLLSAYPGWAAMARLVPDLVTGDIVMADAMVRGVFGPTV
jgi:hypothetical protein